MGRDLAAKVGRRVAHRVHVRRRGAVVGEAGSDEVAVARDLSCICDLVYVVAGTEGKCDCVALLRRNRVGSRRDRPRDVDILGPRAGDDERRGGDEEEAGHGGRWCSYIIPGL